MLLKKGKEQQTHTGQGGGGQRGGWSSEVQETVVDFGGGAAALGDRALLDGLVAGVAPFPADEVRHEHDDDEPGESRSHDDGDQHGVFIQLALLS